MEDKGQKAPVAVSRSPLPAVDPLTKVIRAPIYLQSNFKLSLCVLCVVHGALCAV